MTRQSREALVTLASAKGFTLTRSSMTFLDMHYRLVEHATGDVRTFATLPEVRAFLSPEPSVFD